MLIGVIIIKLIINHFNIVILLFLFNLRTVFQDRKFIRRTVWWTWKCI